MSGARTAVGAVAFSTGKLGGISPEYTCWSGIARCPNGDLLYMTCHTAAGELGVVTANAANDFIRCPAGANPLVAGNWVREVRSGLRAGLQEQWLGSFTDDDGTFMLMTGLVNVGFTSFESPDPEWYQQLYTGTSTDNGTTWSSAHLVHFTRADDSPWNILGRDGDGEQDLELTGGFVQLPDKSIIAPLTVVPSQATVPIGGTGNVRGTAWQCLVRTTDRGVTWKEYGGVPFPVQVDWQFAEASLFWTPAGRLCCMARVKEVPLAEPDDYGMWVNFSDDEGATWGTPQKAFGSSASRPMEVVGPEGDILVGYRSVIGSPGAELSGPTKWRQSWDDGITWNVATTMPLVPLGISAYGQGIVLDDTPGVDGNIGIMYQEEGGAPQQGVAYLTTFTKPAGWVPTAAGYGDNVSSGYGTGEAYAQPATLTIDPASTAWEQIDTQIIVRVTADGPSTVEATIEGSAGGLVRFRGADADLFQVSLDGTTWASAVDVPAGDTTIHLRVTPEAPGTTLTAEIGVPV